MLLPAQEQCSDLGVFAPMSGQKNSVFRAEVIRSSPSGDIVDMVPENVLTDLQ